MSRVSLLALGAVLLAVAACGRAEPEPAPAPVIAEEPVFTGKP
ncbi:MAG: hypothetical protein AAF813_03390 [Pseudomonadota bacterium]